MAARHTASWPGRNRANPNTVCSSSPSPSAGVDLPDEPAVTSDLEGVVKRRRRPEASKSQRKTRAPPLPTLQEPAQRAHEAANVMISAVLKSAAVLKGRNFIRIAYIEESAVLKGYGFSRIVNVGESTALKGHDGAPSGSRAENAARKAWALAPEG